MTTQSTKYNTYIGIDVGKFELVIYDNSSQTTQTIANTKTAINRFMAHITTNSLLICEATGGYEAVLLRCAAKRGLGIHRADALKVKAFIRSYRHYGKTDAIDAKALARYGCERHQGLVLWQAPDQNQQQLQALTLRRADLLAMRTAEKNRAQAPGQLGNIIARSCRAMIRALNLQIKQIEAQIQTLIAANPQMLQKQAVMRQMPGIGPITAFTLLALLPELGTLTRRKIASLAGVAPHPNDSGRKTGYRKVRGGRPEIRKALFMAALGLSRSKTAPLAKTYRRHIQNGKKPMVALTAIMRKLIVIINAKIRDMNKTQNQS